MSGTTSQPAAADPPSGRGHIARTLLHRAHPSATAAQIFVDRVQVRPLHIKPSSPPPPSADDVARHQRRVARRQRERHDLRQRRRGRRQAAAGEATAATATALAVPLSAAERRASGAHRLPRRGVEYETFRPLHRLWVGYVREVLGLGAGGSGARRHAVGGDAATKLTSADYHGALVEVVRSRCVSRVGVRGIVLKDCKFVFEVVTPANTIKVIPKEHTIFRFTIPLHDGAEEQAAGDVDNTPQTAADPLDKPPELVFELRGDQFQYRAAERANRKFKGHFIPDL